MSEATTEPTEIVLRLVEWLRNEGYRAKSAENGRSIISGTSGLSFLIATFPSSLQFYMGLSAGERPLTIEDCNTRNKKWRFTKVYLDDVGDLVVEMDVVMYFDGTDAKAVFLEALGLWDSSLGQVKQWVADSSRAGS
jgi:hypothetical protein